MYQVIIIGHVLVGLAVIGLVLIQHGKGADAGAAFGSGSSGTVFGAQGSASFLSRTTGVLAAVFFSTSLGLAVLSGKAGNDVDLMDAPIVDQLAAEVPTIAEDDNTAPVVITDDVPTIAPVVITDDVPTIAPVVITDDVPTIAPVVITDDVPTIAPVVITDDVPTIAPVVITDDVPTIAEEVVTP